MCAMAFGRKKNEPVPPPQPPPAPKPILWKGFPEICGHCGARVDQAEAATAERPMCRFCESPLPCEPVPQAQPNPMMDIPGLGGPLGALVNNAMNAAMQQSAAMGAAQMQYMAQQGAFSPGGMAMSPVAAVEAKAYLRNAGVPTHGSLLNWTDLGVDATAGRVHDVSVEVHPSGAAPYAATTKTIVPPHVQLSQGMPLNLKVDRNNPGQVLIEWS